MFFQKWVSVYLSHYSICGIYCWWRMQHIRGSFDRGKKAYFLQKPWWVSWWDFGTSAGIPLCCYKVCNAFLRSYTIQKNGICMCMCAFVCVYIYMCGLVFMCIIVHIICMNNIYILGQAGICLWSLLVFLFPDEQSLQGSLSIGLYFFCCILMNCLQNVPQKLCNLFGSAMKLWNEPDFCDEVKFCFLWKKK